jgi:hypothetical protein
MSGGSVAGYRFPVTGLKLFTQSAAKLYVIK